jgi:hypothetical protein
MECLSWGAYEGEDGIFAAEISFGGVKWIYVSEYISESDQPCIINQRFAAAVP